MTNKENKESASSTLKNEVKVCVKAQPMEDESDLDSSLFAFSYTITLENLGTSIIQLLNRHWRVFSAEKQIADVKGEGVVGQQPVLKPGDSFEYSSWTVTKDPIGSMSGSFTFHSEDGTFFDMEVPEFLLIYKSKLAIH